LLSGCLEKQVALPSSFLHSLIHERRDAVIVVTGDKFREGSSVELAPRGLQPRGETLGILEDVVRNGRLFSYRKYNP